VTTFAALLALINIGNTTAFNDIISLVLEGFYLSYLIAIGLLLWRRVRGDIAEPAPESEPTSESFNPRMIWGPWRIKGALGIANNVIACAYLVVLSFFSFWPSVLPVTAVNMNYAVLMTGFVVIFSIMYYLIWARRIYLGPIVEVELHTL
jgi:choline transport protein